MAILKRIFKTSSGGEYEQGIEAYNQYEYLRAIDHFSKVLDEKKHSSALNRKLARFFCAQAHRNIGIIRFAAGNYSGSLQEFRNAMGLNREHMDLYYFMGICHNNLGDYQKSADAFSQLLKIDPAHLPSRLKLAIVFNNLGMWEKSVTLYRAVLVQKPKYADVHYSLGMALLGSGRAREAVDAFKNALAINPKYHDARTKYCITLTLLGEFDAALEELTAFHKQYPEYPDILYYLAIVHAGRDELQSAIERLRQALGINPRYRSARIKLALLYCREGDFSRALEEIGKVQYSDVADKDLESAKGVLRTVLEAPTKSRAEVLKELGTLLGEDTSIEEIVSSFNKSIDISPNFSEMVTLVEKHSQSGEEGGLWKTLLPLALEHVQQHPKYADLRNTLGTLYMKLGQFDEAIDAFEHAVAINPKYVKARVNLFKALKKAGRVETALEHGRYLTDTLNIAYPDIVTAIGEIYLDMGKYDDALDMADIVIGKELGFAPANLVAAVSLERLDRRVPAIAAYERLIASASNSAVKARAEKALRRLKSRGKER